MHQPLYRDPATGIAALPWVRLHAASSYLDVATVLAAEPEMHLTVNFVPSLIAQLQALVATPVDRAADSYETLAFEVAAGGAPETARLDAAHRFFSLNWDRQLKPRARYAELLARRNALSDGDLRDLAVLFHLAWIGFAARRGDDALAGLEARGRDFSVDDLRLVLQRIRAAAARVLPLWHELAARGQVELASSPFYHPIVPLLCDTTTASRARPDLPLPRRRFSAPEDGVRQVSRAQALHARVFGAPPLGMWPPEGSLSPEALAVYQSAGVRWLGGDEGTLWRSLDEPRPRGALYQPWRVDGSDVDLVLRDRELSDRIGFAYSQSPTAAAVADFVGRAESAAAMATSKEPMVAVILDGENAWASYEGGGEPFLSSLFSALVKHERLKPRTIGAHLASTSTRPTLSRLWSGSWIDSDFHIWIGDPVKNRAWALLAAARSRLERVPDDSPAWEPMLAAEGSDWFWWFGEPFHSAEDALFDRLFRAQLEAVYRALGEPPPHELSQPVAGTAASATESTGPRAMISPRIGGTSAYAWRDAAVYEPPRGAAMATVPLVERLRFGGDRQRLYLRLELAPSRSAEADDAVVELLVRGERLRRVRAEPRKTLIDAATDENAEWTAQPVAGVEVARSRRTIELGLSLSALGLAAGARASLTVRLCRAAVVLAQLPESGGLPVSVPGDEFEAENWSV
jgi:alpha-amylase/alpha-mannosidase (GH57 family)